MVRDKPARRSMRRFRPGSFLGYLAAGLVLLLGHAGPLSAQTGYDNPVIAGDHPDPSIVRVGERLLGDRHHVAVGAGVSAPALA